MPCHISIPDEQHASSSRYGLIVLGTSRADLSTPMPTLWPGHGLVVLPDALVHGQRPWGWRGRIEFCSADMSVQPHHTALCPTLEKLLELLLRELSCISELSDRYADCQRRIAGITPRQKQVLQLLMSGYLNDRIAEKIGVSRRLIEMERAVLLKQFQVSNAVELAFYVSEGSTYGKVALAEPGQLDFQKVRIDEPQSVLHPRTSKESTTQRTW